jgi:hypothetical protein
MYKLENPVVAMRIPLSGEDQSLIWEVTCNHSTMGQVRLPFKSEEDAKTNAKFIAEFGICPPLPSEAKRREELYSIAGERPILTACFYCGDNAPETGFTCDSCREYEMG